MATIQRHATNYEIEQARIELKKLKTLERATTVKELGLEQTSEDLGNLLTLCGDEMLEASWLLRNRGEQAAAKLRGFQKSDPVTFLRLTKLFMDKDIATAVAGMTADMKFEVEHDEAEKVRPPGLTPS